MKGDDPKCNIYVAEVIYRATATKVSHKAHEETQLDYQCDYVVADGCYQISSPSGKYFPYRAAKWADTSKYIPYFQVDNVNPKMSDIWAAMTEANWISRDLAHVGIYLGKYNGVKLYISARDNGNGGYYKILFS